jgi:hypothetical protein
MSISQLPKEVRNIVKLQHPCGEDMNLEVKKERKKTKIQILGRPKALKAICAFR